jgi:hypothetical protein
MIGTKVALKRFAPPPTDPVVWVWRFSGEDSFTARFDGGWKVTRGESEGPDVLVEADARAWARFLTTSARTLPQPDIRLSGTPAAQALFARSFGSELGPAEG